MNPRISLIIPAHNEEAFLPARLAAAAASAVDVGVDIIVVLNRCHDGTERIALDYGCRLVREDAKNLSKIRSVGNRNPLDACQIRHEVGISELMTRLILCLLGVGTIPATFCPEPTFEPCDSIG